MADYPDTIYTPRVVENAPLVTFDASKTTIGYAEDVNSSNDEIVAIQETLGLNPQGAYDSVVERLDAMLGWPPGETNEPNAVIYINNAGTLSQSPTLFSYNEDNNELIVGGEEDATHEASSRLRVRDGNILFDNGHGIMAYDTEGTPQAILALTEDDNVDMANPIDGGNFRLLAGEGGQIQFHFGGAGASLRSYMEDTGNLILGDTLVLGDLSERCEFDITNLTDTRVVTLPDNDVLMATAIATTTDKTASRALNSNYTNSLSKSIFNAVTVTITASVGAIIGIYANDNGSVLYSGTIGIPAASAIAIRLNLQLFFIVPPGATYRVNTSIGGTGSVVLDKWFESNL